MSAKTMVAAIRKRAKAITQIGIKGLI